MALPVNPYERTCDCQFETDRILRIDLVLNEDETEYNEVPIFLEDSGEPELIKRAKELKYAHYADHVLKGDATADQIASYQALTLDLRQD